MISQIIGFCIDSDEDIAVQMKRKRRKYSESSLKAAINMVLQSKMSLYRASKKFKIPSTTLKENINRVKKESGNGTPHVTVSKIGKPYTFTLDVEQQLCSYVRQMQEIGFALTTDDIKRVAFSLAEASNINHSFTRKKKSAGRGWWKNFKRRYDLSLRTGRSNTSKTAVLRDFYGRLETVLIRHGLINSPENIWTCDETELPFAHKSETIVTKSNNRHLCDREDDKDTITAIACVNATGGSVTPMVIFKLTRNYAEFKDVSLPNIIMRLSPNGCVNEDLFLDWLKIFAENIPPVRPVMLIMTSHASFVTPMVLEYARSQLIVLFTIPTKTGHILQPLDSGVFPLLQAAWSKELQNHQDTHRGSQPSQVDFPSLFTIAYGRSFTPSNVQASFKNAGIYPLNKCIIGKGTKQRFDEANVATTSSQQTSSTTSMYNPDNEN